MSQYIGIPASTYLFKSVELTNSNVAILPQNVTSKCVIVPCENDMYISKLVNKIKLG